MRGAAALLLLAGCLGSPEEGEPAPGPMECPDNLLANGTFEEGTGGWGTSAATATLVGGGADGGWAVEVCFAGGDEPYLSFDDEPEAVDDPVPGERYALEGWIRWSGAGPAHDVEVVVRQYDVEGVPHPANTFATPDEVWRRVSAALTVAPDTDYVDVYVAVPDPQEGDCVQIDALCLQLDE